LFKLVQQPDGETWILPTMRFLTLHLLFGRTGYPEQVLRMVTDALERGMMVPYRHLCEIPDQLIISMFSLPFEVELPLIGWLTRNEVLFLYDEEPLAEEDRPRYGLDPWLPGEWLSAELRAHPDAAERALAKYGGEAQDLDGYESVVATASATAAAHGGYPAFMLPAIAGKWASSFAPSLRGYAAAEQLLLERLPRRLLGFGDLAELARTDAAVRLREALSGEAGQPDRVGAAVEDIAAEVRRRGFGYRELILGQDNLARLDAAFGPLTDAYPGQAVMRSIADNAAVGLHSASVAINGFHDAPDLLLVPGTELWIPPLDPMYLREIYGRFRFGGLQEAVRTYAPF
jgi:hypothetical protein